MKKKLRTIFLQSFDEQVDRTKILNKTYKFKHYEYMYYVWIVYV